MTRARKTAVWDPGQSIAPVVTVGISLAALSAVMAVAAGLGHRLGLWGFGLGFSVLSWSVYGAIAAAAVLLWGLLVTRPGSGRTGFAWALAGLAVCLIVIAVPVHWLAVVRSVPPIHDITTDPDNPPAFFAAAAAGRDATGSGAYGGAEVAAEQRKAYPQIRPLFLRVGPAPAFDDALAVARRMGWRLVAAEPAQGRFEATATTFWFGFTDDIVVRITAYNGGSRVDVRSASRVGVSDAGTNAERIEGFMTELRGRIGRAGVAGAG